MSETEIVRILLNKIAIESFDCWTLPMRVALLAVCSPAFLKVQSTPCRKRFVFFVQISNGASRCNLKSSYRSKVRSDIIGTLI